MSARPSIVPTSNEELDVDVDDDSSLDEVSGSEVNEEEEEEEALPTAELLQPTDETPAPPPPPPPPYDENRGRLLRITPAQNARYHIARRSAGPNPFRPFQTDDCFLVVFAFILVQGPHSSSTDTHWPVLASNEFVKVNTSSTKA